VTLNAKSNLQRFPEDQPNPILVSKLTLSGAFVWIISRMEDARKLLLNERKFSLKLACCKLVDTFTDSSMCY